ncbi:MAG: hypothetical protein AAGH38_03540 [Pseudomonadota bacterium]
MLKARSPIGFQKKPAPVGALSTAYIERARAGRHRDRFEGLLSFVSTGEVAKATRRGNIAHWARTNRADDKPVLTMHVTTHVFGKIH